MELGGLWAEVEEGAEGVEWLGGKQEKVDFYAAVELSADDRRGPEEITHAFEDTEDTLLSLWLHIA
jgi:hypothetical protein